MPPTPTPTPPAPTPTPTPTPPAPTGDADVLRINFGRNGLEVSRAPSGRVTFTEGGAPHAITGWTGRTFAGGRERVVVYTDVDPQESSGNYLFFGFWAAPPSDGSADQIQVGSGRRRETVATHVGPSELFARFFAGSFHLEAVASGAENVTGGSDNDEALQAAHGTVTYVGNAAGMYELKTSSPDSRLYEFTAEVTLNAQFVGGAGDDPDLNRTISGAMSNFKDGASVIDASWQVDLPAASFTHYAMGLQTETSGARGSWWARFREYGSGSNAAPEAVVGEFIYYFGNGRRAIGAFTARKQ